MGGSEGGLLLGTTASLQAIGTGSLQPGLLRHYSCADVILSLKEDLDCRPDLATSRCPGEQLVVDFPLLLLLFKSLPPCGSARWFSDPGRLF